MCRKCRALLDPSGTQPSPPPLPTAQSQEVPDFDLPTPSESAPPATGTQAEPRSLNDLVADCLASARQKEQAGDLRSAFLMCQSLVIDHFEDLEPGPLASLYLTMARLSDAQGKPQRAEKYRQKANSLRQEAAQRKVTVSPPPALAVVDAPAAAPSAKTFMPPTPAIAPAAGPAEEKPAATPPAAKDGTPAEPPATPAVKVVAPAAPLGRVRTAGIIPRTLATLLDMLLVAAVTLGALAGASLFWGESLATSLAFFAEKFSTLLLLLAVYLVFLLCYQTIFTVFGGQTAGKMLLRLKVVDHYGHTPGWTIALRRLAGLLVCWLSALAGFLWIGFDRSRRGWHDHIGKTMVIRLPATPAKKEDGG